VPSRLKEWQSHVYFLRLDHNHPSENPRWGRIVKPFDEGGAFRLSIEGDEVRQRGVRSAGVTVLSQALAFGIQLAATVVLARLVAPKDFGLLTMVTTSSLLLASFGQAGFIEAVVQREKIDHLLVSNLFWISVSAGLLLTLGFAATGTLMARFYGNPQVESVAVAMSLTIFLTIISAIHLALLTRAMRYSAISANALLARAVSVAVSILLAWEGCGRWALVAGAVAQALTQSIGAWTLCRWIPTRPRRVAGTAWMVRFGLGIYARYCLNYFAKNMDNVLVGRAFGAQSLGFYKKAFDIFVLPASQLNSPLWHVAVSALSRLKPISAEHRRYFLGGLSVLAFVGMGVGADLTLVANDLIRFLLGPGWEETGRIFMFFGPGIGVMLLYETHGWIHVSIGRADRWFRWGIVEFGVTGLMLLLALPWGPVGMAIAWTASYWILMIPAFWYAGRPIDLGIAPVLSAVWKYTLASLLASCTSVGVSRGIPHFIALPEPVGALARIVSTSLCFAALYVGAVILLHRGYAPLQQVAALLREMVPWSGFSKLRSQKATLQGGILS
jgi:polysaccharide transporter, PST family